MKMRLSFPLVVTGVGETNGRSNQQYHWEGVATPAPPPLVGRGAKVETPIPRGLENPETWSSSNDSIGFTGTTRKTRIGVTNDTVGGGVDRKSIFPGVGVPVTRDSLRGEGVGEGVSVDQP